MVSDVLMSQIDWMASLGTLVDAKLPKHSAPDSFDRLDNLLGIDSTDRPWVVQCASSHTLSLRTKDWKYIEPSDAGPMITWGANVETGNLPIPQLYDLRKGIEKENLATQYPERIFDFQKLMREIKKGIAKLE